jgi:hypothetical protein
VVVEDGEVEGGVSGELELKGRRGSGEAVLDL